jgi:hypothetical protein
LSFVKFFSPPLFRFFDLAFYCLFSFFDLVFLSPFVFPFYLLFFLMWFHLYPTPTCLGIKGLVVVVVVVVATRASNVSVTVITGK